MLNVGKSVVRIEGCTFIAVERNCEQVYVDTNLGVPILLKKVKFTLE
jgi:hypothetical protein